MEMDCHGLPEHTMNTPTAVANLFKAFMGIAIQNLPFEAFQAGYLWATMLISLVVLVSLR